MVSRLALPHYRVPYMLIRTAMQHGLHDHGLAVHLPPGHKRCAKSTQQDQDSGCPGERPLPSRVSS